MRKATERAEEGRKTKMKANIDQRRGIGAGKQSSANGSVAGASQKKSQ